MADNSIKLVKKAGGSIIDHKPIFSLNSRIIYVGCGPILRLFNTDSGELIQDVDICSITVEKPNGNIVDITLHPFDKSSIIICFEEGYLMNWSFENKTVNESINLNIKQGRVSHMKLFVVSEEYETFDVIVSIKKFDEDDINVSVFSYPSGNLKCLIPKRFDYLMHSWSVTERNGKNFLAGICYKFLTVFNLETYKLNKDITIGNERYFTCVICHPTQECIAVGDNTGRVILYYDFLIQNNKSPHYIYHWHTLPVNDICFSAAGHLFYSGSNEHVLVKWTVDAPGVRHFLPRLSAPIVHLTTSPDGQFVAVSTLDNAIQIVDTQQNIHCSLQQFTWGFISVPGQKLFPCGLVIDSRSDCIVMNGRPGYIQFFSPQYSTLIYNMDVVGQNYVSQERNKNINNTEVVAVQFSSDGLWLVTAQSRDDPDFCADILLKFWLFDRKSQIYKLETCITLHHYISKILFQPTTYENVMNSDEITDYAVVTLCSDSKFRFWVNNYYKKRPTAWNCRSIGYYREHPLHDICFSNDGSVMGAAFGHCLTIWETETNKFKCSLTKGHDPLLQILFGHKHCSHVVLSASNSSIFVWDLLSLTLIWTLELNVSFIIADPRSEYIAVFTQNNHLFIFSILSSDSVFHMKELCDDNENILCATFFPVTKTIESPDRNNDAPWLFYSSLYFFTSAQELMAFEYQRNEYNSNENLLNITEKFPVTPFQALQACQTTSAVRSKEIKSYLQFGDTWKQSLTEFADLPAHAMPPVHLLCESLLQSLLLTGELT